MDKETSEKKRKKVITGGIIARKISIAALVLELLLLVGVIVIFVRYFQADYQESGQLAEKGEDLGLSCADGQLKAEGVSVKVPSTDNVEYRIAYTWAEGDKEYPSVPYAAVASYIDKSEKEAHNENPVYEISLYRESFVSDESITKEKNVDNWFSDWKEENTGGITKKRLDSGGVHGFLVSNIEGDEIISDYRTYTYTFAVKVMEGLSIYVLEGVCYDSEKLEAFCRIMDESVDSIEINETA